MEVQMEINSNTSLYCIFGNPVSHSLSPVIHNTAFQSLDMDAVYMAFAPENIEEAIQMYDDGRTMKVCPIYVYYNRNKVAFPVDQTI